MSERADRAAKARGLTKAIIFCNRKRDVGILHKSLVKHGYDARALHGDLDQSVRTATLNAFRDGQVKLLIASDVAARGLDIPNVSHIFNFDVPTHSEDYVHRIGRTGRAGRSGTAITLCLPFEQKYLGFIEELIKSDIPRTEVPGGVAAKPREERAPREDREARAPREAREERAPREAREEREARAPTQTARGRRCRGAPPRQAAPRGRHPAPGPRPTP